MKQDTNGSGYQPRAGDQGPGRPPQNPSGDQEYKPQIGEACHKLYTGAHPVKRRDHILFQPMPRGLLGVAG
jgi:hypothetical protein